jgi:hypothetical protein
MEASSRKQELNQRPVAIIGSSRDKIRATRQLSEKADDPDAGGSRIDRRQNEFTAGKNQIWRAMNGGRKMNRERNQWLTGTAETTKDRAKKHQWKSGWRRKSRPEC